MYQYFMQKMTTSTAVWNKEEFDKYISKSNSAKWACTCSISNIAIATKMAMWLVMYFYSFLHGVSGTFGALVDVIQS